MKYLNNPTLVWVDLETTGLSVEQHSIIEIAAVATGGDLSEVDEVGSFHSVVGWNGDTSALHPVVQKMHTDNGLFDEASDPAAPTLAEADMSFAGWLDQVVIARSPKYLTIAGASVHFDKAFIDRYMPESAKRFHHRVFDVSTIGQAFWWWWHEKSEIVDLGSALPKMPHRAMQDITASLGMARGARTAIIELSEGAR